MIMTHSLFLEFMAIDGMMKYGLSGRSVATECCSSDLRASEIRLKRERGSKVKEDQEKLMTKQKMDLACKLKMTCITVEDTNVDYM